MPQWLQFENVELRNNLIASIVLLGTVLAARQLVTRAIGHWGTEHPESRLRWMVGVRNAALALFLFGLLLIWGDEVRTLALSLVAVGAALVFATRELICCACGAILKSSCGLFSVGDRIEINNLRGEVINQNLFSTTLLELVPGGQQGTGRLISLPNALFLSVPVCNDSFLGKFAIHQLSVPLRNQEDWQRARGILLEAAVAECGRFLGEVRSGIQALEARHGIQGMSPDPCVTLQLPDPQRVQLLLRFPVPVRERVQVEQAILERFLKGFQPGSPGQTPDA